jgi:transcriptional regulator with XRE-family HTH domain
MSSLRERPQRVAGKLLAIRRHLGVSQTGMKRLLNFKGDYTRISEFELGRRAPSLIVLLSYARAAGIPLEQIVDDRLELEI